MALDLKGNKEKFIQIFQNEIKRPGADKLLAWLTEKSDFFTAPATGQYVLSCAGGLCQHSINTYRVMAELVEKYQQIDPDFLLDLPPWVDGNDSAAYAKEREEALAQRDETIAVVGLLHDICIVDSWVESTRNEKQPDGKWISKPCNKWDDRLVYGHGAKSVFIIQQFMRLFVEEAQAIRFHMQGKEVPYGDSFEPLYYPVYETCPLAALTGVAVNEATNILDQIMWKPHKPE